MKTFTCATSFYLSLIVFSSILALIVMDQSTVEATPKAKPGAKSGAKVYIVYTQKTKPTKEEPKAYHLRLLSSVLGSKEAAKKALLYSYKTAVSGFAAKLTTQQVAKLRKQPGVIQVVLSQTYKLDNSGPKLDKFGPQVMN